jgi:hypothetical protein
MHLDPDLTSHLAALGVPLRSLVGSHAEHPKTDRLHAIP